MNIFECLGYFLQLAWHFFTDISFFGTEFSFASVVIALISFFLVVRLLILLFWGPGHE